eukprot:gene8203-8287_t
MVGRKLTARLLADRQLAGQTVTDLDLADVIQPVTTAVDGLKIVPLQVDISRAAEVRALIARRPDMIFHLAAIVSGEAEADFDKGYAMNLDGTRYVLDAIRAEAAYCPRLIFTSSIAVFGAPFPEVIEDEFFTTPRTSYGTQKAIGELLVSDYSRRGFVDGMSLRFPTICVRPGLPNAAASGFFSNIIREPLQGKPAILPVSRDVRHWHASPRAAINFLVHAAALDTAKLDARRTISLPGLCVSVAEQIEALRDVAGAKAVALIRDEPNETIARIVAGWPQNFNPKRALALGFEPDASFAAIIRIHLQDDAAQIS